MNLEEIAPMVIQNIKEELRQVGFQIYKTPKWRKIKRYRLLEKQLKLNEDLGLIQHVMED